jgi:AMME syndrome candidate gene 1 protein
MCIHCFHVLVKELMSSRRGTSSSIRPPALAKLDIPESAACPLFVTWDRRKVLHSDDFCLRGCIGTLSPRPLSTSIAEYALTSALKDRRFDPIRLHEVPHLRVAVSLLVKYEPCLHCHDWMVGVHGIIIRFLVEQVEYSATYLPEVAHEQGWTQEEAVRSLVKKAGYHGEVEAVKNKIHCTRYQSSKRRVTYEDYVNAVGVDPLEEHMTSSGSCISM